MADGPGRQWAGKSGSYVETNLPMKHGSQQAVGNAVVT